jgi:hypothetical protein
VREVRVHDDHERAGAKVEAVDVGRAEAELACARLEDDLVLAVRLCELVRNLLRAVGARVVDDDDLPVEAAGVSYQRHGSW